MRIAVIGASTGAVCGVRDSAARLAPELEALGFELETVWDESHEAMLDAADRADGVLWHYSVFAWSRRGFPVAVPRLARELARRAPTVAYVHEATFPFGREGVRGVVWPVAHRIALRSLVANAAAVVVTAEDRAEWLRTRRWLPARRIEFVPVHANVEPATIPPSSANGSVTLGMFGYRRDGQPSEQIVADAIAQAQGPDTLRMVGAPGADGSEAQRWREAAARAGIDLDFTGVLDADALSAELASLDVLLFTDDCGPTPRRGTLAAALAHGRPVIAFDGDQTWRAFEDAGVVIVDRTPEALAHAIDELAANPTQRAERGARARAFYEARLAPGVAAGRIASLLEEAAR